MVTLIFQRKYEQFHIVDTIIVKIDKKRVYYTKPGGMFIPVDVMIQTDGYPLAGILKEFPDLEGKPKKVVGREAAARFVKHIEKLGTEEKIMEYVVKEFNGLGYDLVKNV